MELQTLGGLRLSHSGFTRSKPLLLLSYLAIEGGQSRRLLADLFFFDSKNPRDALSTTYRRLKALDENLIMAEADQLATEVSCDTIELLKELDARQYWSALEHYQGAFLAGLDLTLGEELEEWVFKTREYLAFRVREAQLCLSEVLVAEGNLAEAAKLTEKALELEGAPELEPDDYGRAYTILSLTKSQKLATLQAEAKAFGIHLKESSKALTGGSGTLPHNLTPPTSSFIGRDPELVEMATLLAEPPIRLITLHGPGGIGKSRLALQLAFDQLQEARFQRGIYFVSLESLSSPGTIPGAIAKALGLRLGAKSEPLEQVISFLKDAELLLILDNFEHFSDSAYIVTALIEACPKVKLVITSRVRLNLLEEHVFSLHGLALAAETETFEKAIYRDALQLLNQRAKKVKLDFEFTESLLPVAIKLCQLLEGSPLGIELAAAWVRVIPLAEILTEVEKNLDFLASSARNASFRHKSLRAVFEHSWNLLSAKERLVFGKLSVFKGGFRREAAASVAGATLPLLANLADRSLLNVHSSGRYSWHALLYQFSLEKLAEDPDVQQHTQRGHAEYYREFVVKAAASLRASDQAFWLGRIEEDYDNLLAALAFCLELGDFDLGLDIIAALGSFWEMRGRFQEGRYWTEQYLLAFDTLPATTTSAKVFGNAAWLAFLQGDYQKASVLEKESLQLSEKVQDKPGIASALTGLGVIASDQGDYLTARQYFEESLAINQRLGDRQGTAALLNNLGILYSHLADYPKAQAYHRQSLSLRKQLGDQRGVGFALNNLGLAAHLQADFEVAQGFYLEALELKKSLGDHHGVAGTLDNLGSIATELGDYTSAQDYFEKAIHWMLELGDKRGLANCLQNFASLRASEGLPKQAALLWGSAETLRESIGIPLNSHDLSEQAARTISLVQDTLGHELFRTIWQAGRQLALEEAVAYALSRDKNDLLRPSFISES